MIGLRLLNFAYLTFIIAFSATAVKSTEFLPRTMAPYWFKFESTTRPRYSVPSTKLNLIKVYCKDLMRYSEEILDEKPKILRGSQMEENKKNRRRSDPHTIVNCFFMLRCYHLRWEQDDADCHYVSLPRRCYQSVFWACRPELPMASPWLSCYLRTLIAGAFFDAMVYDRKRITGLIRQRDGSVSKSDRSHP